MPNCLIADMDDYRAAIAAGFSFTRALCGRVPPPDELVASPALVSCPGCTAILMDRMRAEQAAAAKNDGGQGRDPQEITDPIPDAESSSGAEPDTDSSGAADGTEGGDGVAQMLEMVQGHVTGMVGDDKMFPDEVIQCWLEGNELIEIGVLTPEDREFLVKLNGLSGMLGILDLSRRVLSVLHRVQESAMGRGSEIVSAISSIESVDESVVEVDDAMSETSGEE